VRDGVRDLRRDTHALSLTLSQRERGERR